MSESTPFTFAPFDHSQLFPDARFRRPSVHAWQVLFEMTSAQKKKERAMDMQITPNKIGTPFHLLPGWASPPMENPSMPDLRASNRPIRRSECGTPPQFWISMLSEFSISTSPVYGRSLKMRHSFWPTLTLTGLRIETLPGHQGRAQEEEGLHLTTHSKNPHVFQSKLIHLAISEFD